VSENTQPGRVGTVPPVRSSLVDTPLPRWHGLVGAVAGCLYTVVAGVVTVIVASLVGETVRTWGSGGPSLVPAARLGTVVSLGVAAGYYSGRGVAAIRRDLNAVIRRLSQ
jgi:hypothetical protein